MDLNVRAFRVVQEAVSETPPEARTKKLTAARAGRMGGRARASKLSRTKRRKIAMKANRARWGR